MGSVLLVVPCYNEAERLPVERFAAFAAAHPNIAFLFVNDGSTDRTQHVIDGLAARDPERFSTLALEHNRGKAEAVRAGTLSALERQVDYVGFWDADLSTPLEEIPRLVALYDQMPDRVMLAGARVKLLGRHIERRPSRHYLGRIFATVASMLLDIRMYDTQCGAKLFRRSAGVRELFAQPFHSPWLFDLELILRLRRRHRGAPLDELIHEVPLNTWRDISGSKVSYGYFLWAFFDLLALRLRYRN